MNAQLAGIMATDEAQQGSGRMIHVRDNVILKVIERVNELRIEVLPESLLLPCLADRRVHLACLLFDAKAVAGRIRELPEAGVA